MKILLGASLAHFKSQEAEALAIIEAFLNKTVAVADHSNLVGEMNEWVGKLTEARDNIATLEMLFSAATENQRQTSPETMNTPQQEG